MSTSNAKPRRKKRWSEAATAQTANQAEPGAAVQAEFQRPAPSLRRDDLLLISGIGPVTEMALNSIGIARYQDFAGYTPESLAQALQARFGISVPTAMIESQDWIGAALALARQKVISAPGTNAPEPAFGAQFSSRVAGQSQTRAPEQGAKDEKSKDATTPHDGIQIQKVSVTPSTSPAATEQSSENLLRAEINWTWAGDRARQGLAERIPLCFQIHAIHAEAGTARLLAAHSRLWSLDEREETIVIEFQAPLAGRYVLHTVVFSLHDPSMMVFQKGPRLHVVS